jgi:hypothetical protein
MWVIDSILIYDIAYEMFLPSFETASKPPHSKGFASNYAAFTKMQLCVSQAAFPI